MFGCDSVREASACAETLPWQVEDKSINKIPLNWAMKSNILETLDSIEI
jgi:hypothetical protein